MGKLEQTGLIKRATRTSRLFERLVPDFQAIKYESPSQYVKRIWDKYSARRKNKNLNGSFFELLLATIFYREGLLPLHLQAQFAFVPNAIYDLMLVTEEKVPICISLKTSLRERYKQADLEAIVLKNVHRKAKSFLLTMQVREAASVKAKIDSGDVTGLDGVIVASYVEFDKLIRELKKNKYIQASSIEMFSAKRTATKKELPSNVKPKK